MSKLKSCIAVFTVIILLASCSKLPKQSHVIPSSSGFIAQIDPLSIAFKARLDKLSDYKFTQALKEKNNNDSMLLFFQEIGENPTSVGIDFLEDIFIFNNSNSLNKGNIAIAIALSDAEQFKPFIEKLTKQNSTTKAGINIIKTKDNIHIGWNNDVVTMLFPMSFDDKATAENTLLELFTLTDDKKANKTQHFTTLYEEAKDISFTINQSIFLSGNPMAVQLTGIADDLQNMHQLGHITFEDDEVKIEYKSLKNKAFEKYKNKYAGALKPFNSNVAKILPSEHLVLVGFSFNPITLLDSVANQIPVQAQMAVGMAKPVLKNFGGSFCLNIQTLISNTESKMVPTDTGWTTIDKPTMIPQASLAFDIVNKADIEKMTAMLETKNGYYIIPLEDKIGFNLYAGITEELALISTNSELVNSFIQGQLPAQNLADLSSGDALKKGNMYMHIKTDLAAYPAELKTIIKDEMKGENTKQTLKIFEKYFLDIEAKTINTFDAEMNFRMKPIDGNILENILQMVDEFYSAENPVS